MLSVPASAASSVLDVTLGDSARNYLRNAKNQTHPTEVSVGPDPLCAFCQAQMVPALPAAPATVAAYLVHLAEAGYKPATLSRRLAAIAKAHSAAQLDSPTSMKHAV